MGDSKAIIEEVKSNICDECRSCTVFAKDAEGNKYTIDAHYCDNGSGYIELDVYDHNGQWKESCKLKDFTDSCNLPFDLMVDLEPDCNCY